MNWQKKSLLPNSCEFDSLMFCRREIWNKWQMRYLDGSPSKLKNDDECRVIKKLGPVMSIFAAGAFWENERKGEDNADRACTKENSSWCVTQKDKYHSECLSKDDWTFFSFIYWSKSSESIRARIFFATYPKDAKFSVCRICRAKSRRSCPSEFRRKALREHQQLGQWIKQRRTKEGWIPGRSENIRWDKWTTWTRKCHWERDRYRKQIFVSSLTT